MKLIPGHSGNWIEVQQGLPIQRHLAILKATITAQRRRLIVWPVFYYANTEFSVGSKPHLCYLISVFRYMHISTIFMCQIFSGGDRDDSVK